MTSIIDTLPNRNPLIHFTTTHPYHDYTDVFGEGIDGLPLPLTVVEQKMMAASQALRLKPGWDEKILNPEIRGKWKQEMIHQGMKERAAEYVLKEMELYYRKIKHDNTLCIEVSAIDGAYQSDKLIDESIRQALLQAVKPLEDVPEDEKDWHPDSGSLVLDLVHPSLFCLVNDTSPMLSQDCIKNYLNQFHPSLAHRILTPPSSTSTSTSTKPKTKTAASKPKCKYWNKCYRKNIDHLKQYQHPPDHPHKVPEEEVKGSAHLLLVEL